MQEARFVYIPNKVGDIQISTPLVYDETTSLTIIGRGQTVYTDQNINLLQVSQGAGLRVHGLNFAGPGGFSIEQRGDLNGPAGKGIFLKVRDDHEGSAKMSLRRVSVSGVANHGIHISDCSLAEDCGGGGIYFYANNFTAINVGADGTELDEAGPGSIYTTMVNSEITDNLDEGLDFDEEQDGGIYLRLVRTDASRNNDDGYKVTEEDGGDVEAYIVGATAFANGGKGIVLEEEDDGNLSTMIERNTWIRREPKL